MKRGFNNILSDFWLFVREKFELSSDSAPQQEVVENIRKGVEFKGTNLWVLIFAIFIACLGLNIDSTVVIIGAMLISPLMGPIIGIGLSLGTNDFELLKESFRNFLFMVVVSLISATLFFLVFSPGSAQSELLARTTPTTNDVFIALFGGLAGMVAQTRKGGAIMVVSGVAIATTLLPPLCTAGFGIATGEWKYFLGAFYLFCINAIFIAIAGYLMTKFLRYDKKAFLDAGKEKRVRRIMTVIVVVVTIPSVFIGLNIMNRSRFENNADKFVSQFFQGDNFVVLDHSADYRYEGRESRIQVRVIGDGLTEDMIDMARAQMANYGLVNTELVIHQTDLGGERVDINRLQRSYSEIIAEKNNRIAELEKSASEAGVANASLMTDISREAGTIVGNVASLSVGRQVNYQADGTPLDTVVVCLLKVQDKTMAIDGEKIRSWLALRMKCDKDNVKLFMEE